MLMMSCQQESPGYRYSFHKEAVGAKGMVTTAHPLATQVGLRVLQRGGNAVDAAIAVQWALAVVYPQAGNIGGGGFMMVHVPGDSVYALDFREKAPLLAQRDMYIDRDGTVITDKSQLGHLAAGVPGTVDGMVQAHARFGRLSWKDLFPESIQLAARGYRITDLEKKELNGVREDFLRVGDADHPLIKRTRWEAGDLLVQKDLARTLMRIRDRGRDGFYGEETAALLLSEMQRGGGIISQSDLDEYRAVWRTPVRAMYRDYEVVSMPPPSSGGVALLQLLGMMSQERVLDPWPDVETMHYIAEASKRVFADRAHYMGDPDFVDVPISGLLARTYLQERAASIQPNAATPADLIQHGTLETNDPEHTTHFSIVDEYGMAVAVTTTLNLDYGSKVVVRGAGFLLNNEMDDFSAKPGVPNAFGLLGAEANAIAPGKRMLSSMTPVIVLRNGKPVLVAGSPGGSRIITTVFQVVYRVLAGGHSLTDAVQAPRFHHQWRPDTLWVEPGFADSILSGLSNKGHKVVARTPYSRVNAIHISPDGKYTGVSDRRGDDHAQGY